MKVTVDGHTKVDLNPLDYIVINKSKHSVKCKLEDWLNVIYSCAVEKHEYGLDMEYEATQATEVESKDSAKAS